MFTPIANPITITKKMLSRRERLTAHLFFDFNQCSMQNNDNKYIRVIAKNPYEYFSFVISKIIFYK